MLLREYKRGDEKEILAVVRRVLAGYGLETNPAQTDKDLSDIRKYYLDTGGSFKVLDDKGKIVGSCGLYVLSRKTCELRKMYLLPEYQGQGLGKTLLEDALQSAKAKGFSEMVLETNTKLETAFHFYKKYGFQEYTPEHLSDRCDRAMRVRLPPAPGGSRR